LRATGLLIAGAVCFSTGVWVGWALKPGPSGDVIRSDDVARPSPSIKDLSQQLIAIRDRLDALRPSPSDAVTLPERTTEAESVLGADQADLRTHVDLRLDEVLDEVRRGRAGIDELSQWKPAPDQAAFAMLRRQFDADPTNAGRLVAGMTYRDAIRSFGTPTRRINAPRSARGPSGGRLVMWIWELPQSNSEFMMSFDNDVAHSGGFGTLGVLTKYATELGNE
jgi:hypothetical protein